jgi:integrase
MMKHCEANSQLGWLRDVIIGLAHLGVRIGELAGLRWTDVDLDNNVITVADERATFHNPQEVGTVSANPRIRRCFFPHAEKTEAAKPQGPPKAARF